MRQQTPDIMGNILAATAPAQPQATVLVLQRITNDGGTQMRAGMDPETIKEYQEAIDNSEAWPFPPVIVYHDGERYWLADGFHRVNAAHRSGKYLDIPADIRAGTRRDAVLHAAGANASHGLRRTNADKRRAVETLLRDEEWRQWSDREIARRCQVDHKTVSALRAEMYPLTGEIPQSTMRTGADGRTINTANIGTNRPARLYVGDLKGIVAKWMGEHWQHAWPNNPSHTNGEFWRNLTAWMHENVRETWSEGDLKQAIKDIHWSSVNQNERTRQIQPVARPEIFEIQQVVREVAAATGTGATDMRASAKHRIGRFWQECVAKLPATVPFRDLAQAMNNVADQAEQRATPAPAPDADIHHGAGRVPPPPLRVDDLVEELRPHTESATVAAIELAAHGAYNAVRQRCVTVLTDFSYRGQDLSDALQRIANERMEQDKTAPIAVNGNQPLPAWTEEPAPAAADPVAVEAHVAPAQPQADPARPWADDRTWELRRLENTLQQVLRTVSDSERRYGDLTGRHSEVLAVRHGLETMIRTCRVNQGLSD